MLNRYENTLVVKDTISSPRRFLTTYIPEIPFYSGDIYIESDITTRLDLLSYDYYQDISYWPIIASVNNLGKGSIFTGANKQIRIPDPNRLNDIISLIKIKNISNI